MLGHMLVDYLSQEFEIVATVRDKSFIREKKCVEWQMLDAETCSSKDIAEVIEGCPWVINAIGLIKPYINDDVPKDNSLAFAVNSIFPHKLAMVNDCQIIQIATDCVYSGDHNHYSEKASHDPQDTYGLSKSLGEVSPIHHLRCSIIGRELKNKVSLLEWFINQPLNGQVIGYTNHHWNGITTLAFAKICSGIIHCNFKLGNIQHIVPANEVTKAELLKLFATYFKREDIKIDLKPTPQVIDRTLSTIHPDMNKELWKFAGYSEIPTLEQLVEDLSKWHLKY